jgi:PIN domain nuclease of toxin-antitoxin system
MKFHHFPTHHRDPFDLLLVAQAQVEKLPMVTGDAKIKSYDVEVIW